MHRYYLAIVGRKRILRKSEGVLFEVKTRLTVVLAVLLLAFCAVPALAAPKLQVDLSFMCGQVRYIYDEGDVEGSSYPGEDYNFNWALIPCFRIYAEVLPGFGLSMTHWYGSGEKYYSEGRISVHSTQLMGEWQILDLPDGQLSVQGGVRVMAVWMSPFYESTGIDTNLIGPALGISGQIRLVDNLWFFGNISGAVLWGNSYYSFLPFPSPTFAPQGEMQLGLKYAFAPNFYVAASFRGSAMLINPNGDYREVVSVGGPQVSLGLQF